MFVRTVGAVKLRIHFNTGYTPAVSFLTGSQYVAVVRQHKAVFPMLEAYLGVTAQTDKACTVYLFVTAV